MITFTVKVSDSESTLRKKAIIPEGISVSHDDPTLRALVEEAIKEFGKPVEEVQIAFKADW